jgi:predicted HicB family RNase H-like nuclease
MFLCKPVQEGAHRMNRKKGEFVHISALVSPDIAKAAKIQAISEGVSLQDWISQAVMLRLQKNSSGPVTRRGKTA